MSNKTEHIDKLTKEKLLYTEAVPPTHCWEKISATLDQAGYAKKRHLIYRLSAAAVLLLFVGSIFIFTLPNKEKEHLISGNDQPKPDSVKKARYFIAKLSSNLNTTRFIPHESKTVPLISHREITPYRRNIFSIQHSFYIEPFENNLNHQVYKKEVSPYNKIADKNVKSHILQFEDEKNNKNKWKLGLSYAPGFGSSSYSSSNSTYQAYGLPANPNDERTSSNSLKEELLPSFSVGIQFSFKLSEKIELRSGVSYFRQKNKLSDYFLLKDNTGNGSVFSANSNLGAININNSQPLLEEANFVVPDYANIVYQYSSFENDLIQDLKYIELPLLVNYNILNNKYRFALTGGISTGFLIGNNVYIDSDNQSSIGDTEAINKFTLRSVIGFTFEYPISKKLYFTISPLYKYQLNTMSNKTQNDYKINYFDVNSGITFRF